jgi:molybdopterin-guanine dinucleotide biosynthesis protein A
VEASLNYDAIVLCGGASRRLEGNDKAQLEVDGRSLLDRALEAVSGASRTIAVGPEYLTVRRIDWTQEQPPGGGPVAALAAGLALVNEDVVVVLGVDFPFVDRQRVDSVVAALRPHDGAILADETGRHQFLVGAYRADKLRAALDARNPDGMAVKELIAGLDLVVLADPRSTRDVDTWDDVAAVTEDLEATRSRGSGS